MVPVFDGEFNGFFGNRLVEFQPNPGQPPADVVEFVQSEHDDDHRDQQGNFGDVQHEAAVDG